MKTIAVSPILVDLISCIIANIISYCRTHCMDVQRVLTSPGIDELLVSTLVGQRAGKNLHIANCGRGRKFLQRYSFTVLFSIIWLSSQLDGVIYSYCRKKDMRRVLKRHNLFARIAKLKEGIWWEHRSNELDALLLCPCMFCPRTFGL